MNDDAKCVDIHDGVKTLLFEHHFAVNRVQVLLTPAYATRNTCLLQTPFDFREDFLDHLFAVAASGFNHFFNHAIAVWVQRFKTQLFQLGFNVMNT